MIPAGKEELPWDPLPWRWHPHQINKASSKGPFSKHLQRLVPRSDQFRGESTRCTQDEEVGSRNGNAPAHKLVRAAPSTQQDTYVDVIVEQILLHIPSFQS